MLFLRRIHWISFPATSCRLDLYFSSTIRVIGAMVLMGGLSLSVGAGSLGWFDGKFEMMKRTSMNHPTLMAISMGKIPTFRHHNWSNWRSSLGLDSRHSLSPKKTTRQTQSISRLFHMQISEATLSSLDHPQEDAQFVGRPSMMLRFLSNSRKAGVSTRTERLAGHCT